LRKKCERGREKWERGKEGGVKEEREKKKRKEVKG
jgi:hypothetical protein